MGNKKARALERKQVKAQQQQVPKADPEIMSIYVRQRHNWDCGLACTEMAMRWVNHSKKSNTQIDPSPLDPATQGQPLWTVELYAGLRERGVNAEMSTRVRGVNPELLDLDFYKGVVSSSGDGDSNTAVARVNAKFRDLEDNGWAVHDAVSTEALCGMLDGSGGALEMKHRPSCAIVLVNWYVLESGNVMHPEFFGHCILAVGSTEHSVEYLDPLSGPVVKSASKGVFDAARLSPGTDMDLIVVRPTTLIVGSVPQGEQHIQSSS